MIISLCDYSGIFTKPWRDAGHIEVEYFFKNGDRASSVCADKKTLEAYIEKVCAA